MPEAGHIAISSPDRRAAIQRAAGPDPAEEMMAIAWSYAASVYLAGDHGCAPYPHMLKWLRDT
jgi:hypothetical protein